MENGYIFFYVILFEKIGQLKQNENLTPQIITAEDKAKIFEFRKENVVEIPVRQMVAAYQPGGSDAQKSNPYI